ncbi:MAG: hypothetical protein U1E65_30540 [Myxococcota bacterium]
MTKRPSLFFILSLLGLAGPARAQSEDEPPKPLDERALAPWDHLELSMGFLSGGRTYLKTPFNRSGDPSSTLPADLYAPFQHAPFDNVFANGLRYDARLVVSYMRLTIGLDIPFASYAPSDANTHYLIGGVDRRVSLDALGFKDLRFGIGGEYPIGAIAPFVDVLGAVHWVNARVAIDGEVTNFDATSFGFSVRAGARVHVRKWFFAAASGEVGIVGDVRWAAELSVGFALL